MSISQERTIIQAILNGETDEYRFFVERYHRGLIQHLFNLVHDADMAEDIAQEAFIRAHRKLSQYDPTYAFSTWLYKIADNLAYQHLRQHKPETDIDTVADRLTDDRPSPAEYAETEMTNETVRQAIQMLPAAYQQVLSLYYWDGFSYQEIAGIIDRPVGTVRTWLHRSKEALRKELYGRV